MPQNATSFQDPGTPGPGPTDDDPEPDDDDQAASPNRPENDPSG